MKLRSALTFLAISLLAVACARIQMPRPTELQAREAQTRSPGVTVAELDHGRQLYVARCSVCHQPVLPTKVPAGEWPGHVQEMRERAHLSVEEARLVENYLVAMASEPIASR